MKPAPSRKRFVRGARRHRSSNTPAPERRLADLISVGPALLRDFDALGIRSVAALARANPERLYERLCRLKGVRVDVCCLDAFRAAVAQARDPHLPPAQALWWYWSHLRKAGKL